MARKQRIEFPGALYHVIIRGNNKENIFKSADEKEEYLNILRKYKERYFFKLYAFALMDNHGHLLIEVDHVPLSKIMQGIQQVYTAYYNRKHKRVGHVFQQRYKALLCNKDSYLLSLIRYIHYHPVEAGITDTLQYKWSSHCYYMKPEHKCIVDTEFPLSLFNSNPKLARRSYQSFINESLVNEPDFELIHTEPWNVKKDLHNPRQKRVIGLEELLVVITENYGLAKEAVLSKSRVAQIVKAKRLFVYLAARNCTINQRQIAQFLGMSESLIARYLADFVEDDEYRQNEVKILGKLCK